MSKKEFISLNMYQYNALSIFLYCKTSCIKLIYMNLQKLI